MSEFKKVVPGQRVKIPAELWNTMQDSAEDFLRRRSNRSTEAGQSFRRDSGIVLVMNSSGSDLDRMAALGLGDPLIPPSDSEDEFVAHLAIEGLALDSGDFTGRFAVLLEPCGDGEIALAAVTGVAAALVDIASADDLFAEADIASGHLISASSGSARQTTHVGAHIMGGTG